MGPARHDAQSCLGYFVNNTADVGPMDISMPGY